MKGRKCKAGGGGMPMKVSGNPDVFKEAEGRKKGGKVMKAKKAMKADGAKAKHRMDRPGRKTGGRVGADKAPLSSAHGTTSPSKQAN